MKHKKYFLLSLIIFINYSCTNMSLAPDVVSRDDAQKQQYVVIGTIEDIKAGIGTDRAIDGVIHIIDRSEVPKDRSFRNAWTYTP